MQQKERCFPPDGAISYEKSSTASLQQGACLAEEVGGVGGETRGTARVRAGFAPNQSSSPAQRSCISERGCGGCQPLRLRLLFPEPNRQTNHSADQYRKTPRICFTFICGHAAIKNLRVPFFVCSK